MFKSTPKQNKTKKVNKTLEKIKKRDIIIDINMKNNNKDTANNKIS